MPVGTPQAGRLRLRAVFAGKEVVDRIPPHLPGSHRQLFLHDGRVVVIVTEHVADFVHHGGEQVEGLPIVDFRLPIGPVLVAGDVVELFVECGCGVDKPAVSGGVDVLEDGAPRRLAQPVAGQIGNSHVDP